MGALLGQLGHLEADAEPVDLSEEEKNNYASRSLQPLHEELMSITKEHSTMCCQIARSRDTHQFQFRRLSSSLLINLGMASVDIQRQLLPVRSKQKTHEAIISTTV